MSDTLSALFGSPAPQKKVAAVVGEEVTQPTKPAWVIDSEKKSGVVYDWEPSLKQWRPRKNIVRGSAPPMQEETPIA
jgi:hypothetical protein